MIIVKQKESKVQLKCGKHNKRVFLEIRNELSGQLVCRSRSTVYPVLLFIISSTLGAFITSKLDDEAHSD